jgi:drug/metabolite transporter (DMT)-like permease
MVVIFCIYLFFSAVGLLLIKIGGKGTSLSVNNNFLKMDINLLLLMGMICYIVSFLLYIYIINKQKLSYIVPVTAGVLNIVVFLLGVLILKEKINIYSVVGLILIILGVFFINLKNSQ